MEDKELNALRTKLKTLRKEEEVIFLQILAVQEQIFAEVDRRAAESFRLGRNV